MTVGSSTVPGPAVVIVKLASPKAGRVTFFARAGLRRSLFPRGGTAMSAGEDHSL